MSERRSVWVIEQGSYSDYRVVGVFSSKENAERVAEKINAGTDSYNEAEVAEWPMDPGIDALNQNLKRFHVLMLHDGSVEGVEELDGWDYYPDLTDGHWLWERTKAPAYQGRGIPDVLNSSVWARDEKHAVKVSNERRVQMIASGEWS